MHSTALIISSTQEMGGPIEVEDDSFMEAARPLVDCVGRYRQRLQRCLRRLLDDETAVIRDGPRSCWYYHIVAVLSLHLTNGLIVDRSSLTVGVVLVYVLLAGVHSVWLIYSICQRQQHGAQAVMVGPLSLSAILYFGLHIPMVWSTFELQPWPWFVFTASVALALLPSVLICIGVLDVSAPTTVPLPLGFTTSESERAIARPLLVGYCMRTVGEWLYTLCMAAYVWTHPACHWAHCLLLSAFYCRRIFHWLRWAFADLQEQPIGPAWKEIISFLALSRQSVAWTWILTFDEERRH